MFTDLVPKVQVSLRCLVLSVALQSASAVGKAWVPKALAGPDHKKVCWKVDVYTRCNTIFVLASHGISLTFSAQTWQLEESCIDRISEEEDLLLQHLTLL